MDGVLLSIWINRAHTIAWTFVCFLWRFVNALSSQVRLSDKITIDNFLTVFYLPLFVSWNKYIKTMMTCEIETRVLKCSNWWLLHGHCAWSAIQSVLRDVGTRRWPIVHRRGCVDLHWGWIPWRRARDNGVPPDKPHSRWLHYECCGWWLEVHKPSRYMDHQKASWKWLV